jgi:glycosyltransferase involved in cell wall biosynthesis
MLIGIDASRATAVRRTGTEAYAYYLIQALLTLTADSDIRLRLYFNQPPPPELFPRLPHVEFVVIPFPRLWTHLRLAWELRRRPPDLFFTPAHVIPWSYRGPAAATVHDLGYHHFPEAHPRRQLACLRWSTGHNGRRAHIILADSEATKADLIRLDGVPADKITVVYPGAPPDLQPVTDDGMLTAVAQKYGIAPPYLLYLGTLQPRKNLARLVAAYANLLQPAPQLVLAGQMGWLAEPIVAAIQASPTVVQERIILPGFVNEADKAALLSGATAVVYPSLYEGFGFPVLEAQLCGTAVLCANTSSLPEVAGDAALLVDPLDTAALTAALQRLIMDSDLRQRLIAQGQTNAARFTWETAARQALAAFRRIRDYAD